MPRFRWSRRFLGDYRDVFMVIRSSKRKRGVGHIQGIPIMEMGDIRMCCCVLRNQGKLDSIQAYVAIELFTSRHLHQNLNYQPLESSPPANTFNPYMSKGSQRDNQTNGNRMGTGQQGAVTTGAYAGPTGAPNSGVNGTNSSQTPQRNNPQQTPLNPTAAQPTGGPTGPASNPNSQPANGRGGSSNPFADK